MFEASDRFEVVGDGPIEWAEVWLDKYARGEHSPLELPLGGLPPFTRKVLEVLQEVPFGETVSYQEVARRAGSPQAVRAAGSACGRNPFPLLIPCHRVIQSDGSLGGFSAGLPFKRLLLEFEKTQSCAILSA